jgi:hypothetical protein
VPDFNKENEAKGVKWIVLKDYQRLDDIGEAVIIKIKEIINLNFH